MTVITDLSLLEYLHDAECHFLMWDCSDRSMRRAVIRVRVDDDSEYTPWNGRVISVTFANVVACRLIGWGYQGGHERIDTVSEGVSSELELECDRLRSYGLHIPPLAFTITLGTGSTAELVCQEVSVCTTL